jgi:hypothetical protein
MKQWRSALRSRRDTSRTSVLWANGSSGLKARVSTAQLNRFNRTCKETIYTMVSRAYFFAPPPAKRQACLPQAATTGANPALRLRRPAG